MGDEQKTITVDGVKLMLVHNTCHGCYFADAKNQNACTSPKGVHTQAIDQIGKSCLLKKHLIYVKAE